MSVTLFAADGETISVHICKTDIRIRGLFMQLYYMAYLVFPAKHFWLSGAK